MFCTNCGYEFEGNFCPNCGTRAYAPPAQPAPPAAREYEDSAPQGYPNGLTEEDLEKIYKVSQNKDDFMGSYLMINYDIPREQSAQIVRTFLKSGKSRKKPSIFSAISPKNWPARQGRESRVPNEYDKGIYRGEDPIMLAKKYPYAMQATRVAENEANGIFGCPKCGSTNVLCEGRDFSVGAAAVGGILMGDVGLYAGVGSGKNLNFTCLECGETWKFRTR